ncbi:MAG TPA: glycosyltransferase family 4 protein [Chthoniobacteraceae bacterium]|nr:glycosyltransferase family 4 protein [Chthoniobacteraceae bacterium]
MTPDDPRAERPIVFINFWREGGMRHYSESLVHALQPAARVFYLRNYDGATGAEGAVLDLDFRPLRPRNWPGVARVARLLREMRPRAVHLNNEQPALLPLYPMLARMNSVITLHDARSHAGERLPKRLFHSIHLRLVRRFIRKVIVHSAAIRDALPLDFPSARVHVVPHVNYSFWASSPAPPPPTGMPLTVLFFGRILPYKGLDVMLDAFRKLDPARFRLIIAGEGEVPPLDAPNIEIDNRFVTDDRLPGFFQRAHVVALPYHAASQSGVAQMAFAFGRPVVATRVGALPDIVHDEVNGLLIPPGDSAALAAALERLADSALRARMQEAIRRDQSSSDAEIRARLLAIYDA